MIIMQHFHLLVIQLICRANNTTLNKLLIIIHFDEVTYNNLFSTHSQCSSWNNSTSWWFSSSLTVWSFCRANNTTEYYRLLFITDYCTLRQYHQFQSLLHSLKIFGATPSPLCDTTYRQLHGTSPEHTLQLLISDHRTSNYPY